MATRPSSSGTAQRREPGAASVGLYKVAVIIPAWQPDTQLLALVDAVQGAGLPHILLVDDGSDPSRRPLFGTLQRRPGITLCTHPENLGKGRALKTAFEHVLRHMPHVQGVVTADADGQHLPSDIFRVAQHLLAYPDRPVLGVRAFSGEVPFRSRFGNAATRALFAGLTGCRVTDTQTGLRGLPRQHLTLLSTLEGERYEYEMVMLATLCRQFGPPAEVPIETVYLEQNRGSHFHPLRDSLRVYRALLCTSVRLGSKGLRLRARPAKPHLRTA